MLFIFSGLVLNSCQEEIDITEGTDPNGVENTNNLNSETTNFYRRVSMHDGSFDDNIDQNSCSSVILPVSLTANGNPLVISNTSDYALVDAIFNQSDTDEDIIVFDFPIQVMNHDYTTQTIANQQELNNLIGFCNQLIIDNENPITCIDFIYNIGFSVFNSNLNQSTIKNIASDFDLFNFIKNLSIDEVYAAQYPIEVSVLGNSTNTFITSDNELEASILGCISDLQSQDPNLNLNAILTNATWQISNITQNGADITAGYSSYQFNFVNDFTMTATNTLPPFEVVNGNWQSNYLNNVTSLNINLTNNAILNLLNREWTVTAFTSNQVNLKWNNEIYLTLNSI
ncbi:hypothetical protein ACFQ1O_04785 [Pseudofulvibacter geojedonensis]|uniref:Lipoprotein n=2 Tax=Pseudofulvibacter geojedonensis TaxID=1123758 RepID=A0ABW3I0I9_9FLAO